MSVTEVAILLAVIAFIVLVVFLIQFLSSANKAVKNMSTTILETKKTITTVTKDVDVLASQVEELLIISNELLKDVQHKSETIDPFFTAIADLSESVSDLNDSSRYFVEKMTSIGDHASKASFVSKAGLDVLKALKKREVPHIEEDEELE